MIFIFKMFMNVEANRVAQIRSFSITEEFYVGFVDYFKKFAKLHAVL